MTAEDVQAQLRQIAERGVGFDMNPTMMFTTAESMYSQWLDYFTRLDQEWRERVAALADALSTPPADDVGPWRPEDGDTRCQQCGQPNPIWWADNAQWNATVGGPDATDDPGGVLCPTCYHAKWLGREVRPVVTPADDVREALGNLTPLTDDDLLRIADRPGGVNDQLRAAVTAAEIDAAAEVIAEHRAGTVYPSDRAEARAILEAARQVRPHKTVTDAERSAINAALIEGLPMWTSKLEEHHARKALLDRIVRALETTREVRPHGTVTDAEVEAALDAYLDGAEPIDWQPGAMRDALKAAREVRP